MAKLYVKAFGIAAGLVAGGLSFVINALNMIFYLESDLGRTMAMFYLGYRPTLFSIIFNSLLCFGFAFCLAGAFALLYNRIIEESTKDIEDKIKQAARNIWEAKGKPEGSSAENWKEAQIKVRGY